jgi:hypothetical protein
MASTAGMKLRCVDGRHAWGTFRIEEARHAPAGTGGYEVFVSCSLTPDILGHWLAPDPSAPIGSGREIGSGMSIIDQPSASIWPSRAAAQAALARYTQQDAGR